jgi:polyphosphate kinase
VASNIRPALLPAAGRYINRDESWLLFNDRVLEEATDATNPLLERAKFLAITASNLDEFLEIRIAGLLQQLEELDGLSQANDEGGLTQAERVERLKAALHGFASRQNAAWTENLRPALEAAGIRVCSWNDLSASQKQFATKYFQEQIDPLLTPVTLDPAHPFPRVLNKAMCLALLLRFKRKPVSGSRAGSNVLGVVTIPLALPNLIALPERTGKEGTRRDLLMLDELIAAHAEGMFRGYRVLNRATFRVTRNSNLYLQDEESRSLLDTVREELHNRRKGDAVRLEIDANADAEITERLSDNFDLEPWQVFRSSAPVNLSRMMDIYRAIKLPELKFPEFHGRRMKLSPGCNSIFDELRHHDVLLHHPFDSYSQVEEFFEAGRLDPNVISIKQTLYRTSADSRIFRGLKEAAQTADVTVVVELMARFDEASNIRWARELEDAGVQVFHGIYGQKTHCKLALMLRREPDGMRAYAHLGTGNYNPVTARFYTDISLLTSRQEITDAVSRVFRYLTADWQEGADEFRPLMVAPLTLAPDILALIKREAEHAKAGRPARIIAKMNALLDGPTIDALYAASEAGVEIDLIIRGMCALRPGFKGLSERIRVRSIVGRYLEHSRIFWFENGGQPQVFAGSADWMPRNLFERCEVVFPVTGEHEVKRLRQEILEAYLRDDVKARLMQPDGTYRRAVRTKAAPLSAQDWLTECSLSESRRAGDPPPGSKVAPAGAPAAKRAASAERGSRPPQRARHTAEEGYDVQHTDERQSQEQVKAEASTEASEL